MVEDHSNDRGLVVVTGTSTGIGAATVSRLANNAVHVFAGVRREEDAEAARTVANGAVTPLMPRPNLKADYARHATSYAVELADKVLSHATVDVTS